MMLGISRVGTWLVKDRETKIGMRIGYSSGAGSKLAGMEKNGRLDLEGHMRHRRLLETRRSTG
jgi:hypothetical protein